jgi:predicted DNA-binding transcriptional regulator AlpA
MIYFKQQIVRPAELAAALGVSTVTLWHWRKNGTLPEPITFGPRFVGWPNQVLTRWLEDQQGRSK